MAAPLSNPPPGPQPADSRCKRTGGGLPEALGELLLAELPNFD